MKTTLQFGGLEARLRLRLAKLAERFNTLPRKMQRAILLMIGLALSLLCASMWMPVETPAIPPVDNIRSIPVGPRSADSLIRNLATP